MFGSAGLVWQRRRAGEEISRGNKAGWRGGIGRKTPEPAGMANACDMGGGGEVGHGGEAIGPRCHAALPPCQASVCYTACNFHREAPGH